MKWIEFPSRVQGICTWGTIDDRGISFVISLDSYETPSVYRCSYKEPEERMEPFVKLAHRIGVGFDSLRDAMIACEAKSKELAQ